MDYRSRAGKWTTDPKTELVPRVNSLGKMSNFLPLLCFIVHGSEGSAVPKIEEVIWPREAVQAYCVFEGSDR